MFDQKAAAQTRWDAAAHCCVLINHPCHSKAVYRRVIPGFHLSAGVGIGVRLRQRIIVMNNDAPWLGDQILNLLLPWHICGSTILVGQYVSRSPERRLTSFFANIVLRHGGRIYLLENAQSPAKKFSSGCAKVYFPHCARANHDEHDNIS